MKRNSGKYYIFEKFIKSKAFNQPIINVVTILFALLSLIIAVRSCVISERSIQISQNSYELNLAPILNIEFTSNISEREYGIKFSNDGPIPIYELNVEKEINFYDTSNSMFQSEKIKGKPWIYREELAPGDTFSFPIEFKDLQSLYLGWTKEQLVLKNDEVIRTILFRISYKKKPEMRVFSERKYLFVEPIDNFGDTTIYGLDPDKYWITDYRKNIKILEARENVK